MEGIFDILLEGSTDDDGWSVGDFDGYNDGKLVGWIEGTSNEQQPITSTSANVKILTAPSNRMRIVDACTNPVSIITFSPAPTAPLC